MMVFKYFSIFFLLCIYDATALNVNARAANGLKALRPSENYMNSLQADDDMPGQYIVYWKYDNETIQFEIHCKSTGWCGLGLSGNGGMRGADIAIGWVDDTGKGHVVDTHATGSSRPKVDKQQDWTLLDSAEVDGYTILKIKRKLNTCDKDEDRSIQSGTTFLIFAWNDEDPVNNKWDYHGENRRSRTIILLSFSGESIEERNKLPDDVISFDFKIKNISVPLKSTYYFCDLFEIPKTAVPLHIVAYDVITRRQNKKNVHHFLGYECEDDYEPSGPLARECGPVKIPIEFPKNCMQKLVLSFGIGGDPRRNFPKEAGYLIRPSNKTRYMFLEMHYDNAALEEGIVDDSVIRIHMSPTLRQHNLGVSQLNTNTLPMPPGSKSIKFTSVCFPGCTEHFYPEDGITVVTGGLHTHLAGRAMRTTLVRNGTAVKYLFDDQTYDANYQNPTEIEPTKLYKGDALITECTYDTTDRKEYTTFGFGTYDEMCINFIYYYPQIPQLSSCGSSIRDDTLRKFYQSLDDEKLIGDHKEFDNSSDYSYANSFEEHLKSISFSKPLTQKFEKFLENPTEVYAFCGGIFVNAEQYTPNDSIIKNEDVCLKASEDKKAEPASEKPASEKPAAATTKQQPKNSSKKMEQNLILIFVASILLLIGF